MGTNDGTTTGRTDGQGGTGGPGNTEGQRNKTGGGGQPGTTSGGAPSEAEGHGMGIRGNQPETGAAASTGTGTAPGTGTGAGTGTEPGTGPDEVKGQVLRTPEMLPDLTAGGQQGQAEGREIR